MNRAKITAIGILVAVLLVGVTYAVASSLVKGQMAQPSAEVKPEAWDRIASALERIAGTMEKSPNNSEMMGGMMQGMGPMQGMMGQGMMGGMMNPGMMGQMNPGMMGGQNMMGPMQQMQGMMQNCHSMMQMMQEMQQMMKQMEEHMGQMMPGRMGQNMANMPQAPSPQAASGEASWTRASNEGSVDVKVTYMNPLLTPEETSGKLVFKVALDTHTVDLSKLDLTKLATLRTNAGLAITEGFTWEAIGQASSHHRTGLLKIADTMDGKAIVTSETQSLELELKEIAVPSRIFTWQLQK